MEDDRKEQADLLYLRGLRLLAGRAETADAGGPELGAELCQKALELYRRAGDHDEAGKVETLLVSLSKNAYARLRDTQDGAHRRASTPFSRWPTFLRIGCFGFGGPMGVFTLLQEELVRKQRVLTSKDFLEGKVLADVLPGPITMDIVTYTGYKLKKWSGALLSTLLFIVPSFVVMLVLAMLYDELRVTPEAAAVFKCLGAAVTGLIISVALRLTRAECSDYRELCVLAGAFASALLLKLDIVVVVALAGLVGIFLYADEPEEQIAAS